MKVWVDKGRALESSRRQRLNTRTGSVSKRSTQSWPAIQSYEEKEAAVRHTELILESQELPVAEIWMKLKRLPCGRSHPTEAKFPETERKAGLLWREKQRRHRPLLWNSGIKQRQRRQMAQMSSSHVTEKQGVWAGLIYAEIKLKHAVICGANRFESSACTNTKNQKC